MTPTRAIAAMVAAGLALLAALWMLAIAPKRVERTEVRDNVALAQEQLDARKAQAASYENAHKRFRSLLSELHSLDRAVPSRGAISALLRQLQQRARARNSDLRIVSLKESVQSSTGSARTSPGAAAGPGNMSALPFTFEYTGRYFDLLDILATVRGSVRTKSGKLVIDGRLLTVDGLAFKPVEDSSLTNAVINATAYIAPDGTPSPQQSATAAPSASNGGS